LNGGSSCKNCGSFKDADTCKDYGLQVLVPRSRAHWVSLKERFGDDYFKVAMTGVYAPIKGDYRYVAMNSYDGMPEAGYKALDGGNWWFRPTKYGEPNGNYDSGNWLKVWKTGVGNVDNMEFDDHNSKTNSVKYICSENHETKTTLYLAPPTGTVKRLLLSFFSCCSLLFPVANLLDVFDVLAGTVAIPSNKRAIPGSLIVSASNERIAPAVAPVGIKYTIELKACNAANECSAAISVDTHSTCLGAGQFGPTDFGTYKAGVNVITPEQQFLHSCSFMIPALISGCKPS
jgi:hypothetical protein